MQRRVESTDEACHIYRCRIAEAEAVMSAIEAAIVKDATAANATCRLFIVSSLCQRMAGA